MLDSPKLIVDLLAKSLPSQSVYFIQISFVSLVVQSGMELLRVVPIVMAGLRSFIGPKLTEKERKTTHFGLRPLNDPQRFSHADFTAQAVRPVTHLEYILESVRYSLISSFRKKVLYFMVLLVYSVLAPLTNFILAFNFLFLGTMLRHQFLYVYPRIPDSGGVLWSNFIGIFLSCMMFAQVTSKCRHCFWKIASRTTCSHSERNVEVLGLLGLKKAKIASPFFFPLMVCLQPFVTEIV